MAFVRSALVPAGGDTFVTGQVVYDEIAAILATEQAWDLDDTITHTGPEADTTHTKYIWRCSNVYSKLLTNFYVIFDVAKTTSTDDGLSGVRVSLVEDYNSAINTYSKYAPFTSTSTFTLAADRTLATSGTVSATAAAPPLAYFGLGFGDPATLELAVLATEKAAVISTDVDATYVYVGAFQSFLTAADDPMPICLISEATDTNFTGGPLGAVTRFPKASTMTPILYPMQLDAVSSFTIRSGSPGDATNWDLLHGGPVLSRLIVQHWNDTGAEASLNGTNRGLLRGVLRSSAVVGGAAWGDYFDVNGIVYLYVGGNDFIETEQPSA